MTPSATSTVTPRPTSGTNRIGPYILSKVLGQGSTGRVRLGVHYRTSQKVAIKIIPKTAMLGHGASAAHTQNLAKKMEREIVIMKLVQHPSVMQLYDVYETDEELYLVLEHVEGGELFDYLVKKGRLDEQEACSFFQQIIYGVHYCHQHLICHRDLKPENLLLDSTRKIKVADFGMASLQQIGKQLETSCGSPHYASPEIIKGVKYDGAKSDIWSCGVILYALLAGNLPFDDDNIRRLLSKVKAGKFYMPPHISPAAQDLIQKMLVVDPDHRMTMDQIKRHPWFKQVPEPKDLDKPPLSSVVAHDPVATDSSALDPDVLQWLSHLGWADDKALRAVLLAHGQAAEKVFYQLLVNRKVDDLETYLNEESDSQDRLDEAAAESTDTSTPRRRAESLASMYMDRLKGRSEMNLNGTPGELRGSVARMGSSSGNLLGPARTTRLEFRGRVQSLGDTLDRNGKPLPNGAGRAASLLGPGGEVKPRPLSIAIPQPTAVITAPSSAPGSHFVQHGASSSGTGTPLTAPAAVGPDPTAAPLGTPKFHRRRLSPPSLTPPSPSPAPVTPSATNGGTGARRSWFASLFHFRPESVVAIAPYSAAEAMAHVRHALDQFDVRMQDGRRGGIKCKAVVPANPESAPGGPTRDIKFRIDVRDVAGATAQAELTFALQNGPLAGMDWIVHKLVAKHVCFAPAAGTAGTGTTVVGGAVTTTPTP
ncbi:CAMK/CAMKL/BRSK protein kinase [Allomyces macrogynus ATCC 38327]|uniref:non-specific serine/threonine protein kinase n=1 Tax=Allomyces macrogynus (strain ATCC 38327) TaxID=578462 RepID=A0A0L0S849_ALLM3|nr:CAMK/CAMKL/BRSK protein kinase [Allomyces macrogynus ATCC 38327]|eukprot:KNE58672.1 CAMK/CAMKL/BRSK protein kinase [Allomyces macrogynus ATCC 38327]